MGGVSKYQSYDREGVKIPEDRTDYVVSNRTDYVVSNRTFQHMVGTYVPTHGRNV